MEYNELKKIVDNLLSNNLRADQIDFEGIVGYISQCYDRFAISGDQIFEKNYCKMIMHSLEKGDMELLGSILNILLLNSKLISDLESGYLSESEKAKSNFRDYCHELLRAEYYRNRERICTWYEEHKESSFPKNYFEGRCAVYCVVTGDYDVIREPNVIMPGVDYYLFTNNREIVSNVWNVILLDNEEELSNVLLQRKTKILGHKILEQYDYTIYIDGKFEIVGNLLEYVSTYTRAESMLCFPHPSRNTIKDEADAIVFYGKDTREKMDSQLEKYRQTGFKDNYGVVETACLVRSNRDDKLKAVMNDWWKEIVTCSHRDQMSLPYVCWKNDYIFDYCDLNIYHNDLIKHWGHK